MTSCQARQYSDEMHCARCRLRWDVNDPSPPACQPHVLTVPSVPLAPRAVTVATRSRNEHLDNAVGYVSGLPEHFLRGRFD